VQLPTSPYIWNDNSAPPSAQRFYRAVEFPIPGGMAFIPPGTFRMGSPTNEVDRQDIEGPQTTVVITHGSLMGKYPVTQEEYFAITGNNPSRFPGSNPAGLTRPVEQVSWNDATNYCALLTIKERVAGHIPPNSAYRLPTEAEWEYACRALTSTRFSFGDDPGYTNLATFAWNQANSGGITHPVGEKLPNPWGLYDMHGNVFQWCLDWVASYPGGIVVDPHGPPSKPGPSWSRIMRGGSWFYPPSYNRSASRGWYYPESGVFDIGFRVVLVPGSQ